MSTLSHVETQAGSLAAEYAEEFNHWQSQFHIEMMKFLEKDNECVSIYNQHYDEIHNRYKQQYEALFNKFCTIRKRVYGGPEGSISARYPSKFDGIHRNSPYTIIQKSKSRIEVVFENILSVNSMKQDYMFVLLKKAGDWKIDSYKSKLPEQVKWDNGIL